MSNSRNLLDVLRVAVMGIATALEYVFGGYDGIFITLVIFITLDYLTGIGSAYVNKTLSSRIGAHGILKKVGILCIIALTTIIEKNILKTASLRNAVILYYISNEGISLLENICKLGVPVPEKLRSILQTINGDKIGDK